MIPNLSVIMQLSPYYSQPLHMGISPGEKLKKKTGPRLLSEPKFDLIKKWKKPPPFGCREYQNCISIKANHNCSSRSQKSTSPHGHFTWSKTEKNNMSAAVVGAKIRPDQKMEKTTAVWLS